MRSFTSLYSSTDIISKINSRITGIGCGRVVWSEFSLQKVGTGGGLL
jgi:hypothetical protein